jgi:hypothetical protein
MKKIIIALLVLPVVASSQIEKIDIMPKQTVVYDLNGTLLITDTTGVAQFNATFVDSCEMVTINLTMPIKRIVKFYKIQDAIPESFVEVRYNDMTNEQKYFFDNFVNKFND